MKKIGILTIQKSPSSYGANLQCYALWYYIKSRGYDCEVIDLLRPCHKQYKNYMRVTNNNAMLDKKSFRNTLKNMLLHTVLRKKLYIKENDCFISFWNEIVYSQSYNLRDIYNNKMQYDIYITGSDQVWNPTQNYKIEPYFLTFTKKNKISYGASMGIQDMPNKMQNIVKNWLIEYDYISVREDSLLKDISNIIQGDIVEVVDPTFLLTKHDWMPIVKKSSFIIQQKDYFLFYSLTYNEDFTKMIMEFCAKNPQYEILVIDYNKIVNFGNLMSVNNIGPSEFLSLIYNAKYVVTDSFHCMAFSIIFDIPFSVIKCESNEKRMSRMESILKKCDSLDRIKNIQQIENNEVCFDILNKDKINNLIDDSKLWLLKSLETCNERT